MRFASFASTQAACVQSDSTRSPLASSASRASSSLRFSKSARSGSFRSLSRTTKKLSPIANGPASGFSVVRAKAALASAFETPMPSTTTPSGVARRENRPVSSTRGAAPASALGSPPGCRWAAGTSS